MASKSSIHEPDTFILLTDKEISEKRKFFTLRAVTPKRRDIFEWVIKGQIMALLRGPNAFWAKIG